MDEVPSFVTQSSAMSSVTPHSDDTESSVKSARTAQSTAGDTELRHRRPKTSRFPTDVTQLENELKMMLDYHYPCQLCHSAIQVCYRKGPLSQKSAGHMQNRKTKTNTNPSPDPNQCRRHCPDPNARIQKFMHYMAIATFAIADLCDSRLSTSRHG